MGFLSRAVGVVAHGVKAIGKYVHPVAKFIGKYHREIATVAHGAAVASGSQTAQKYTGAALALSQTVGLRQNLNADNAKIAAATRANGGQGGVFNLQTGRFN